MIPSVMATPIQNSYQAYQGKVTCQIEVYNGLHVQDAEAPRMFIKFVGVLTMLGGPCRSRWCFAKEYELSRGASTERTEGHLLASEILPVDIADLTEDGAQLSQGKSAMGCQWARSSFQEALDEIRLDMWPQSQQLDVWILNYSVCCCIDLFDLKKT